MKKLKKATLLSFTILAIMATSIMIACFAPPSKKNVALANSAIVTLSSDLHENKIGALSTQEFVLSINIKNNTNEILGVEFDLWYDNSVFTFVGGEKGNLFSNGDFSTTFGPVKMLLFNMGALLTQPEVHIANLIFKLNTNTAPNSGNYNFHFTELLISDSMGEPIEGTSESLTIHVEAPPAAEEPKVIMQSSLPDNQIDALSQEEFVLSLTLKNNNSQLLGVEFDLWYDSNVFTFVGGEKGSLFSNGDFSTTFGPVKMLLFNIGALLTQPEVHIANLTFKLNTSNGPSSGSYNFHFTELLISDSMGEPIEGTSESLTIVVKSTEYDTSLTSLTYPSLVLTSSANRWVSQVPYTIDHVLAQNFVANNNVLTTITFNQLETGSIILAEGLNTIEIVVTAPDNTQSKYYLDITRQEGNTNTEIEQLVIKDGSQTLAYTKTENAFALNSNLDYDSKNNIKLNFAKPSSSKSTLTIDGQSYAWGNDIPLNLVVGENQIPVVVTPEKGDAEHYTVIITVNPQSSDSSLVSLNHNLLNLTRQENVFSSNVEYSITQVNISGFTAVIHEKATITYNGKTSGALTLNEGDNSIIVIVTAQDGTASTYSIQITREHGNTNATIKNLTVKQNDVELAYTQNQTSFTVDEQITFENRNSLTLVLEKPQDSKASLKINGSNQEWSVEKQLSLEVGSNTVTITVTPEKGAAVVYSLNINVEEYYYSTITTLSYSGVSFIKNKDTWQATVAYTLSQLNLQNFVTDKQDSATITFNNLTTGTIDLEEGLNPIEIVVTAKNNQTSTYYLNITRVEGNTNTEIESLIVKEGLTTLAHTREEDVFAVSKIIEYENKHNIKALITKPQNSNATITISGENYAWGSEKVLSLSSGINNINIVVTPEKGEMRQYKITIDVLPQSSDSSITNLTHASINLTRNTNTWMGSVGYKIAQVNISEFTVVIHNKSTITIGGKTTGAILLEEGPNSIPVIVTAQDGSTTAYSIEIVREQGNTNASIENLVIKQNQTQLSYIQNENNFLVLEQVPFENRQSVSILIQKPTDSKSTLSVNGSMQEWEAELALPALIVGDNIVLITVIPEKGEPVNYKLHITVEENYTSEITTISHGQIQLEKQDVNTWAGNAPYAVNKINVQDFTSDKQDSATITFNNLTTGTINLEEGLNTIEVVVTAKNNQTSTYYLNITRLEGNTSTEIESLVVKYNSTSLPHERAGDTFKIEQTVPYIHKNDVKIVLQKPIDSAAVLKINNQVKNWGEEVSLTLVSGEINVINITVLPEKGEARAYTLEVALEQSYAIVTLSTNLDQAQIASTSKEEFTITIAIEQNQDAILGVEFDLWYDSNVFTFVGGEKGNLFSNGGFSTTFGPVKILLFNVGAPLTQSELHIANLTFKLNTSNGPSSGNYNFHFTELLVSDPNGSPITTASKPLSINVFLPSSNSTINLLDYDGINFIREGNAWLATVAYTFTQLNIENFITDKHSEATITFNNKQTGTIALEPGQNTINLVVTAEDGKTKSSYQVRITRQEANINTEISRLMVLQGESQLTHASTENGFILESSVAYSNRNSLKVVLEKPEHSVSLVKINEQDYDWGEEFALALQPGANTINIKVIPELATHTKTYVLVINVSQGSSNANLSSLTLTYYDSTAKVIQLNDTFQKDKTKYTAQVRIGTASIFVSATVEDEKSVILSGLGIHELSDSKLTVSISVQAEDGTVKQYEITIIETIMPSENNQIKNIVVQGYDIQFDKVSFAYILEVPYNKKTIEIIAQAEDPMAEVYGTGKGLILNEGDNKFEIYAKSQSGEDGVKYFITITRLSKETVVLQSLKVLGFEFEQQFVSSLKEYTLTVPQDVSRITVEANLPSHLDYYEVSGANVYHDLPNIGPEYKNYILISIIDKSENSDKILNQYKISVTRYSHTVENPEETEITEFVFLGVIGFLFLLSSFLIASNISKSKKLRKYAGSVKNAAKQKNKKPKGKKQKNQIEQIKQEEVIASLDKDDNSNLQSSNQDENKQQK